MSISTIVTRGYGSFGSVNKIPTKGYSIGAAPAVVYTSGPFYVPQSTEVLDEFSIAAVPVSDEWRLGNDEQQSP